MAPTLLPAPPANDLPVAQDLARRATAAAFRAGVLELLAVLERTEPLVPHHLGGSVLTDDERARVLALRTEIQTARAHAAAVAEDAERTTMRAMVALEAQFLSPPLRDAGRPDAAQPARVGGPEA